MKSSFHWLVFSSALFSAHLFSAPIQIDLTSRDSFDGSSGGSFLPKISAESEGTTYLFKDSVTISNVLTPTGTGAATTCFSNTAGTLSFLGNGFSFAFKDVGLSAITSTATDKIVSLSGFSTLSFVRSPAESLTTGLGTISVADALSLSENTRIVFQENFSTENGGAIKTKNLSLTKTSESALFSKNKSTKKGGAIFSTDAITLSENSGTLIFSENSSVESGAALSTEGNLIIENNTSVSFLKNSVTGTTATTSGTNSGGAICGYKASADTSLTISGNKSLTFIENSSTTSGGAIFIKKLDLSSGGLTIFKNNTVIGGTAPKGGAIAIESGGEISLSADSGDIIFEGNTISTTIAGVTTLTRNAISIGANGKISNLRAAEGLSIFFYDPITIENGTPPPPATTLIINAPATTGTTKYSGTIVFSGEQLSTTDAAIASNVNSTIKQPVVLAAGALFLKSGVTLTTEGFTQTSGSQLLMEGGTSLIANDDITLTNLAINLDSSSTTPAIVDATAAGKNLTITGPIDLIDTSGQFYENHDLRETLDRSLLILKAKGSVTHTGVPAVPLESPESHFGYQGSWNITWATTAATEAAAKFTWTKTGYIASPERKGFLVPNSLWATFSDVRSLQQLMEGSAEAELGSLECWGAGLSNFMHRSRTSSRLGFRHIAAGYVLGVCGQTLSDDVFSLAFCQLFCRDKDYVSAKNQGSVYGGSLYYEHARFFSYPGLVSFSDEFPIVFSGHLSYLYTSNKMKTLYPTGEKVKASWGNNCLACALGGSSLLSLPEPYPFHEIAPFIKLQFVYAKQQSFKENSIEARHFSSSNLENLSLPIGVSLQKESEMAPTAYDVTIMYVVDVVRSNPDCTTTLLISGDSWTTSAANLSRQAMVLRAGNHHRFNPRFEMFSQFAFELRGSSRNYNANLCGKLSF